MAYQSILNPMPVTGTITANISGTVPVSGTFWQATQPVSLASTTITGSVAVTGSFYQATQPVSISATVAISAASLPLPAGAATETTLAAISTKTPALGQGLMAASQPVVIASNQSAVPVSGTFWQTTQPVSLATAPTTPVTGTFWQATQPVSLTSTTITGSVAVTGTFFQATQPISGTVTANAGTGTMAVSIATMPSTPVTGTFWQATQPVSLATNTPTIAAGSAIIGKVGIDQTTPGTTNAVVIANEAAATFRGRATTFRAVGRAGTTPRRLLTLWNNTGSGKVVHINQVFIDLVQTAVIAFTVIPPVIRVYKITAAPSGGTAVTKNAKDNLLTSNASITLLGDASADGTNSGTALACTTTAGAALTQEFAPRLITAAGYEMFDRSELLVGFDVVCRAGEGIVVSLDLTLATQDAVTSSWVAGVDWWEA